MKMIRNWALGLLLLCLAPGCSSFHREWRAAGRNSVQPGALTGRWEGTWQNTNNTHRDRLRAIITQTQPGTYRAFFHARYKRVLTFSYAVPLTQQGVEGDRTLFRGEADLGKLAGGRYKYEGWATPSEFFSSYDSKYDVGTFTMRRLQP